MTPEEANRFHPSVLDVPPSRLRMQEVLGTSIGCVPVTESKWGKAIAAVVSGEDPTASGYVEVPSAQMLRGKLVALVESMRGGYRGAPVDAAINELGQIVLTDGFHRTSVAIAMCLATIPTRIVYRSEPWQTCKRDLCTINRGPQLYQPVDHPDLAAWPAWRVDTAARAEIIGAAARGGRCGVDLACHTGGVTVGLARQGFEMLGFDTDPLAIRVASYLRTVPDVGSMQATFMMCSELADVPVADFVVCLSLLNHHQEDQTRWAEGAEIFRRCVTAAPLVVLDCPTPGDPVGGASEFVDPEAVFRWCAQTGAPGAGSVLAWRGDRGLQRTLLAWRR